jgi:hypothetical protein
MNQHIAKNHSGGGGQKSQERLTFSDKADGWLLHEKLK